MRVLLIDNYDSFVYNLAQYIGSTGAEPVVVRASASLEELKGWEPDAVVVSPGPGHPVEAGSSVEAIRHFAGSNVPLLGVCLGHQAIGIAFGGEVVRSQQVMHGRTSPIRHSGQGIFRGLPDPFVATRYHSLIVSPESLPEELEVTAESDGLIMGIRHRDLPVEGVQFHPESVLTTEGMRMIENFLDLVTSRR